MKVALIGNMNNNFFSLTRYLRDEGIDAELIVVGEENIHFGPVSDAYRDDYLQYTKFPDWIRKGCFTENKDFQQEMKSLLRGYDFLIGCGYAPFFADRYGFKLDIAVPYGDDLYRLPFPKPEPGSFSKLLLLLDACWRRTTGQDFVMKFLRRLSLTKYYHLYRAYKLAWHQRRGLQHSTKLAMFAGTSDFDLILSRLGLENKLCNIPFPIVYHRQYTGPELQNHRTSLAFFADFYRLRQQKKILVFHHARHIWFSHLDEFSNKGNDVLFRGLAQYIEMNKMKDIGIVTVDYGPDVEHSRRLIADLGIADHVLWLPKMARKDIMALLPQVDIGANCFSKSWLSGGVMYEFMVMGIPILQHRESTNHDVFPVLAANNATDVATWLARSVEGDPLVQLTGKQAQHWYETTVVSKSVDFYVQSIKKRCLE